MKLNDYVRSILLLMGALIIARVAIAIPAFSFLVAPNKLLSATWIMFYLRMVMLVFVGRLILASNKGNKPFVTVGKVLTELLPFLALYLLVDIATKIDMRQAWVSTWIVVDLAVLGVILIFLARQQVPENKAL